MDKRRTSSKAEPIPSILKKPKSRHKGDLLDKSTKIKREKVENSKKGADVSFPLPHGCTPLMYACQQADYKTVVETLNKDPSSVRIRDRGLRCALHYCASSGGGTSQAARAACADRVLMAAPTLADARDADGLTPLHLAVVHGNVPLVQALLAAGADVNARDDEHHTVVHWATVCGEVGALRAVLSSGADAATPDQHGGYPLHYAAQMCGAPAVTDHQSRGTALEVLRALIKEGGVGVDVRDADGRTPLLWAASAGSAAAVLALHQAGAKVDDADRDGLTALHCAAARGHTEALETLVGLCGARVDVADSHGCTPLHYAAALGHADATATLLQHGAEAHRQDRRGRSPAHTAAAKGQIETVRILGARGANLWLRNSKGELPLHEAVASGRRELVKWLLDGRPSQVNATNHEGRTPLHIAAATDNADLCRLLLDRGAEINPVSRSSKNYPVTPLDAATSRGYRSIAKYLQMHGGLPASKLAKTNIVFDVAPITALPIRKVTSTKIDVQDRIRIEKREVVEVSSPGQERRIVKAKIDLTSSDGSISDSQRILRKKTSDKNYDKHHERRKRFMQAQKSFSDGYDTDIDGYGKAEYFEQKYKKLKKHRSKSEPSKRHKSAKYRHRCYKSGSDSSSFSESYNEKKKYKSHRKRSKRKSSSSSESSSSESTERRSTKRKGKKTSIHIENDDIMQSINIVKYKNKESYSSVDNIHDKPIEETNIGMREVKAEASKGNGQIGKSQPLSGTETDTVSIKTNKIITEAQIHIERDLSHQSNSEITVTVDSLNNVSIEALNMAVSDNEKKDTVTEEEITHAVAEEVNDTKASENVIEEIKEFFLSDKANTILDSNKIEKNTSNEPNEEAFMPSGLDSLTTVASDDSNIKLNEEKPFVQNSKFNLSKEANINQRCVDEIKSNETLSDSKTEVGCTKSFQILSGPKDKQSQSKNTSEDLKTSLDALSTDTSEHLEKSSSPIVTFASKDDILGSKESDLEHLMGEEIVHGKGVREAAKQSSNGLTKASEKTKDITIKSSSSDISNLEKGLVSILDSDVPANGSFQEELTENHKPGDDDIDLSQSSPRRPRTTSRDSIVSSRRNSIYETESYKVLSGVITGDKTAGILKKSNKTDKSAKDSRDPLDETNFSKVNRNIYEKIPSISDNEIYQMKANGRRKRFRKKGRAKSRTTIRSMSEHSERGYESSGFMDSGFEPSPRAMQRRITSPRLAAYYRQRNAGRRYSGKSDSRIPVRKPGDKNAVDMMSVTQQIQTNMRRYYCERKIFQHLLELKRLQIRTSKTNEAVLVKRAIDEYNKSSLASVGLGPYSIPDYSFSSFEKFLYESLRKLQKSGKRHLDNLPETTPDFDYGESELYEMSAIPDNPCLCTSKTHRCFHAIHAYTGIPCAAYLPSKWNHHTMLKPATAGSSAKTKGFLPKINPKPPIGTGKAHVTLEVSHGSEKQLIALPAERLDKNKRYYVTFTVKGSEPPSDNDISSPGSALKTKNVKNG